MFSLVDLFLFVGEGDVECQLPSSSYLCFIHRLQDDRLYPFLDRERYNALQSMDPIPIFLVSVLTFSFDIFMVAIIYSVDALFLFSVFSAYVLFIGAKMVDRTFFGAADL